MPGESSTEAPDGPMPPPADAGGKDHSSRLSLVNVSMSWTAQAVAMAGSFIVTPALINALGEALYGAWMLINSFIGQLRALDLGMSLGTMKYSAGALARGDVERLRRIHSTSAAMFLLAAMLALVATVALAVGLPLAFPRALAGQQRVILVLGLAVALDFLLHPQPASLRARSFFFIPDALEVATYAVFKFGLVLYLAKAGLSLWMLCLLILGESITRNALLAGAGFWLCDWTRHPNRRSVDRSMLRTLALYGGGTFLINVGEMIRFQLDSAVIGYFLSTERIAVYTIGMRLIHIAYQAIGVIGAVSVPRFSGLHEGGDRAGYERLLGWANLATGLAAAYILVNIAYLGSPFLEMWIRKPWVGEAFIVTLIMLPAYFVGLLSGPGAGLLVGAGKLRRLTLLTLAEAACNLVLSVALAPRLGIYGVCLGTAIPMAVFRGAVFPFVLRKDVGLGVWAYYRTHGRAVALTVLYAALILPVRYFRIDGPVAFLTAGACTTAVFGLLVMVAVPEVRQKVAGRLFRGRA